MLLCPGAAFALLCFIETDGTPLWSHTSRSTPTQTLNFVPPGVRIAPLPPQNVLQNHESHQENDIKGFHNI